MSFVNHRFVLDHVTVDHIHSLVPKFGYNGFGEVVFYRTYSRTKPDGGQESWNDVVLRVTAGTYSIRKDFYLKNYIPWDEEYWQGHAYGFAKSMFQMKWMPPGRGLWAMGSDFVYERGAMALYNCAYTDITSGEGFTEDICWIMDTLMHGVGVGFSPLRDDLSLKRPVGTNTYIIPDTREGWVESIRRTLNAYVFGRPLPICVFDLVRRAGLPIKGFGGVSSGPEPLKKLLIQLVEQCELFLTGMDVVEFKTNVANLVGCCVVAGNVRRSAEISCGSIHDPVFMNLKNYILNPHREAFGWMSNNSVLLDHTEDFDKLGEIAERVIHNGEPGVINRKNLKFGRIGKETHRIDYAVGFNPCQPAWAKVLTPNGIRDFGSIQVGDKIWSEWGWTEVLKKWSTGTNKVYKYTTTACCFYGTEDHRVVSDGFKIPVKDAPSIDCLQGPKIEILELDPITVLDGLLMGDGTIHGTTVLLEIGEDDQDYFQSEIASLLNKSYSKPRCHKVLDCTVKVEEIPHTFLREIPERFLHGTTRTICSFLRGLYSANGSVCGTRVSLKASSKKVIEQVQIMLSAIGIASYYTTNKAKVVKFENGEYLCKESYDLQIGTHREAFAKLIGFIQKYKMESLYSLIASVKHNGSKKVSYEIISVELISEEETFDITVKNPNHTYWTNGSNVSNCGEIPLEHREVCNLSETLPTMCDGPDDWYKACEYATFYSSTVSLLPTHQPSTNRVVARNRRIGVGIIDFSGWKHSAGVHQVTKWLRNGYDVVTESNRQLNGEAGVPEAIRKTTVKPGGTTPKLAGRTSGCGHPTFHYTLRRVRVAQNAPIHPLLVEANIPYEKDYYSANTDVFEFPILQGPAKPATDVSLWEQAMSVVLLQREWADNAVSNTLYFRPMWRLVEILESGRELLDQTIGSNNVDVILDRNQKIYFIPGQMKITYEIWNGVICNTKVYEYDHAHEEMDIEPVLSSIIPLVKSVSLLPHTDLGAYRQMVEEGISKEEYERRLSAIHSIDWTKFVGSDGEDEKYCTGESCELPLKGVKSADAN